MPHAPNLGLPVRPEQFLETDRWMQSSRERRPPKESSPLVLSGKSETRSAECGTSRRENSSPAEIRQTRVAPSHKSPSPALRLRDDPALASGRSCRAGRKEEWPDLQTSRWTPVGMAPP